MKLIINADDFGLSNDINQAILKSFHENLISSTTMMANMPGFKQACEIVSQENLQGKIGLHLTLTEGYPVTEEMSGLRKLCDTNGEFTMKRDTLFYLNQKEKEIIYREFQAQLDKLLENNIIPTHIDSHHHYHTEWAIGKKAIKLAKKNNIPAIRLARNIGADTSKVNNVYRNLYNFNLMSKGLAKVKYFGSVNDVLVDFERNKKVLNDVEVMVHPQFTQDGELIDDISTEQKILLDSQVKKLKTMIPQATLASYE